MAVTETRSLVNPTLEGSLTAFLKKLDPLGGQQINTATYAPQVAARNALQTAPETAAAGLGALTCLLYTSPSPRDRQKSRMPSSA